MIFGEGLGTLLLLGLWIFCIIDVITTDESAIRNLPKPVWLLIVILLFDLGSLAWLIAGRNWNKGIGVTGGASGRAASRHPSARAGSSGSPGSPVASRPTNPDDDEEFLCGLRKRADEQRRNYQEKLGKDEPDEDKS